MRSQSSRPNLNLATWPFGLENGEYYIGGLCYLVWDTQGI
jgi:hypothetical protein